MSTKLLKRKNGDPYDPNEQWFDGKWEMLRYLGPYSDGQVLDRTTVNRDGGEMGWHERKRYSDWATAELFVPIKDRRW
ncbi:hypothetical protein LCGC14_2992970 [marine sediment metagenome]|uniref:Uncharacterized protein n=1 Tax=marine sediment metagenome TaxID=412755 RepID=A0A0F8X386_9ZZZZ